MNLALEIDAENFSHGANLVPEYVYLSASISKIDKISKLRRTHENISVNTYNYITLNQLKIQ